MLVTTADELGDPRMTGRRAWVRRWASLVYPIATGVGDVGTEVRRRRGAEAWRVMARRPSDSDKQAFGVRHVARSQDRSVPTRRLQRVPTLQNDRQFVLRIGKALFGFCRRCRRAIDTAVMLMLSSFSRIVGDIEGRMTKPARNRTRWRRHLSGA
jgi:hypothetical protein